MINELYSVYQGLKDVGEEPEIKHNDIVSPGKGPTFRVCLSENGEVESFEFLKKDKIKDIWSIRDGQQNQFPAVKFEYPFIPDGYKDFNEWKSNSKNPDIEAYREIIIQLLDRYPVIFRKIECWPSYRKRILERKEQLTEPLLKSKEGIHLYELFKRYNQTKDNGIAILSQFADKLIHKVSTCGDKEELKTIASTLFGDSVDQNNGKIKDGNRVTLLIDCLPQKDLDIYATSRRRLYTLSKALFESERGKEREKAICALTNKSGELINGSFPSENINVVGPTFLFAKSDLTSGPAVKRYGKAGSDSFSLNRETGEKLAASLVSLTKDSLRGKTWKQIPPSSGTSQSLLLGYCKSKFDLAITPIITGASVDDFDDYQSTVETVLGLYDRSNCTPNDSVEIVEIRVLDKANRKINYSTTSSIGKLGDAAKEWIRACKNCPDIKLFAKIKNGAQMMSPWTIAPIDTVDLSRNRFKYKEKNIDLLILNKNGRKVKPPPSISFSDAMFLFISEAASVKAQSLRYINILSSQFEPLFQFGALSKNQWLLPKKEQRIETKPDKNSLLLKTVSLFAILLYKTGREKEEYMNNFAYQLGQLCSAIDELHIGYCKGMRRGDIPNSLIGNATYNIALQSPMKALAFLASRIKPYKVWAKKTRVEKNKVEDKAIIAGLSASIWLENHSPHIEEHLLRGSQIVNDTYKAELMLVYLAGRPFEKTENDNSIQGGVK